MVKTLQRFDYWSGLIRAFASATIASGTSASPHYDSTLRYSASASARRPIVSYRRASEACAFT
jgi:hypothetical protein